MKRIKVTITAVLELPDEFLVTTSPPEGNDSGELCLRRGNEYYMPSLGWLEREKSPSSDAGTAPSICWSSVGDDVGDELLEAACSDEHDIQEIGPGEDSSLIPSTPLATNP